MKARMINRKTGVDTIGTKGAILNGNNSIANIERIGAGRGGRGMTVIGAETEAIEISKIIPTGRQSTMGEVNAITAISLSGS